MAFFSKKDADGPARSIREGVHRGSVELDRLLERLVATPGFVVTEHLWMLSHPENRVRKTAYDLIEKTADPGVAEILISELKGKPRDLRSDLARLAYTVAPRAWSRIVSRHLQSRRLEEREIGLDLLAVSPSAHEMVDLWREALADPIGSLRRQAVEILETSPARGAASHLLRGMLDDSDESVRHAVIESLARHPRVDLVEPFFSRLFVEPPRVRAMMVRALGTLASDPNARLEERVIPMLADDDPVLRETAVDLLRDMPDPLRVLRAFILHSRGMAHWLRRRSESLITKFCDRVLDHLLVLMQDSERDIRVGAMTLAAGSKDPRYFQGLRAVFLGDEDWWVRGMAAEQIARFGSRESVEVLAIGLNDPELRHGIVSALGEVARPEALARLVELVGAPDRGLRMAAVEALARYDELEAMERIFRVARDDQEPRVRDKARVALGRYGSKSTAMLELLDRVEGSRDFGLPHRSDVELRMVKEELNAP